MLSMGSHGLGFVLIVSGSDHVRQVIAKLPVLMMMILR
jgi:hypothetical protein